MRFASVLAATAALALWCAACSTTSGPVAGTYSESTVTKTATVEKIDLATRHLTLRDFDGRLIPMTASEGVRNLPQVKVGDQVVVSYYESVTYEVKKPGEGATGVVVGEVAERARPGTRPGGMSGSVMTVTCVIDAIDKSAPSVTLRKPDGEAVVVPVRDRSKLDHVSVGDLVEVTYTEALLASVKPGR